MKLLMFLSLRAWVLTPSARYGHPSSPKCPRIGLPSSWRTGLDLLLCPDEVREFLLCNTITPRERRNPRAHLFSGATSFEHQDGAQGSHGSRPAGGRPPERLGP